MGNPPNNLDHEHRLLWQKIDQVAQELKEDLKELRKNYTANHTALSKEIRHLNKEVEYLRGYSEGKFESIKNVLFRVVFPILLAIFGIALASLFVP